MRIHPDDHTHRRAPSAQRGSVVSKEGTAASSRTNPFPATPRAAPSEPAGHERATPMTPVGSRNVGASRRAPGPSLAGHRSCTKSLSSSRRECTPSGHPAVRAAVRGRDCVSVVVVRRPVDAGAHRHRRGSTDGACQCAGGMEPVALNKLASAFPWPMIDRCRHPGAHGEPRPGLGLLQQDAGGSYAVGICAGTRGTTLRPGAGATTTSAPAARSIRTASAGGAAAAAARRSGSGRWHQNTISARSAAMPSRAAPAG
jgi:hypothetical protein